jgi:F420-0:gamma-glutamyl ligase
VIEMSDETDLYAEPVEQRAERQADTLDNAFGNLLRGNNTDGIAVVLEQDGEEEVYRKVETEDEAIETAQEIGKEYGIDLDEDLDYDDLLRD